MIHPTEASGDGPTRAPEFLRSRYASAASAQPRRARRDLGLEVEVCSDSGDGAYQPNDDDDSSVSDNEGIQVNDAADEGIDSGGFSTVFQDLMRDAEDAEVLDDVDLADPNIVDDDELVGLQSDCDDAFGENLFEDSSDEHSSGDDDDDEEEEEKDVVASETSRVMATFTEEEAARLQSTVQRSSAIFNEEGLRAMSQHGWTCLPQNTVASVATDEVEDRKYAGYCGPSKDILASASTVLDLFFYFLPKSFWHSVASESNRYWRQTVDLRVEQEWQRSQSTPRGSRRTRAQIEAKLLKFKKIFPHEIVQYIGLLLAHVLCPQKRMRFHWSTVQVGALPAGTFGSVMSRERFEGISRYLHFSNNRAPQAAKDRAWKIRPVLTTLEKTFKQGYVLGYRVALDEGMLPSRNRHNPTRTYMKDKPHKWGSKCVLTCCAVSGYCKRYDHSNFHCFYSNLHFISLELSPLYVS